LPGLCSLCAPVFGQSSGMAEQEMIRRRGGVKGGPEKCKKINQRIGHWLLSLQSHWVLSLQSGLRHYPPDKEAACEVHGTNRCLVFRTRGTLFSGRGMPCLRYQGCRFCGYMGFPVCGTRGDMSAGHKVACLRDKGCRVWGTRGADTAGHRVPCLQDMGWLACGTRGAVYGVQGVPRRRDSGCPYLASLSEVLPT
jgi:hypothetical protein